MVRPWFKFYSADYLLDPKVDSLSLEAQGILIRLWCLCARDGSIPDDRKVVARRAGIPPKTLGKYWDDLRIYFRISEGLLVSDRMIREQGEFSELSEKRKACGSLGGKAKVANAIANDLAKSKQSDTESDTDKEKNPTPASAGASPQNRGDGIGVDVSGQPSATLQDPGGKAVRPKRRTRAQRDQDLEIQDIPADAIRLGHRLIASWRKTDPDGREIRCEADLLITRLSEINQRQPRYTWQVLEEAAKAYLASNRKSCKAPQYFFTTTNDPHTGMKPPFKGWADAAVRKLESVIKTSEAALA